MCTLYFFPHFDATNGVIQYTPFHTLAFFTNGAFPYQYRASQSLTGAQHSTE